MQCTNNKPAAVTPLSSVLLPCSARSHRTVRTHLHINLPTLAGICKANRQYACPLLHLVPQCTCASRLAAAALVNDVWKKMAALRVEAACRLVLGQRVRGVWRLTETTERHVRIVVIHGSRNTWCELRLAVLHDRSLYKDITWRSYRSADCHVTSYTSGLQG